MEEYKVILLSRAYDDLDRIYEYYLNVYSEDAAKNTLDKIKDSILNLCFFPQSHQDRTEGRYANQGYKQIIIGNYLAIFKIYETEKIVSVNTIIHQHQNK